MKATAWEFRYRFWIFLLIYILGFTAPWDAALHLDGTGPNTHVWARLAMLLYRDCGVRIGAAFNVVLIAGILCAGLGAWLRTWGSAYLSVDVMRDGEMRSDSVVADGPYRYLRNPLYLGVWVHTLALALLMPLSGAIFTMALIVVHELRLIFGEEAFLRGRLGEAYLAYCAKVPRLLPALGPRVRTTGARARWAQAALAEIFMWGVTASFAVLGWQYDAHLLLRAVLVWFGVSLVVRALGPQSHTESAQA
ncbi:MAG TPA: isoprenylcysteine carboxylmethyltransferase family protein [Acidobacteriaceae bacterium]|nr:isoprenylcysteine carboxylmethyltransferase family protein [Acidobacteriaceae bacterium]